ncbi:MAG: hypothetical protein BA861_06375 [Desulfobacterales bacterium S3730MH5]|nr:MAG: hypothetical protein BA861_06375 [Desulfobacterales bacterium S3730MH5]
MFGINQKKYLNLSLCVVFVSLGLICLLPGLAASGPREGKETARVIMVGDRLVDIAYNLGVLPEAMVVRCIWPAASSELNSVRSLGCPKYVTIKNKGAVAKFAATTGIKRILIENSKDFSLYAPDVNPMKVVAQLEGKGFDVESVDFSDGIESAIEQMGRLLNREAKAGELIKSYKSRLKKSLKRMPDKKQNKKVLILRGIPVGNTGKFFVQVEASKGYSDRFFLKPMGCENRADLLQSKGTQVTKGYFLLKNMADIAKANPDVIIITGESFPVQKALSKHSSLFDIPAVKNHEIYSLPLYIDSSVIEYPNILMQWTSALCKQATPRRGP